MLLRTARTALRIGPRGPEPLRGGPRPMGIPSPRLPSPRLNGSLSAGTAPFQIIPFSLSLQFCPSSSTLRIQESADPPQWKRRPILPRGDAPRLTPKISGPPQACPQQCFGRRHDPRHSHSPDESVDQMYNEAAGDGT